MKNKNEISLKSENHQLTDKKMTRKEAIKKSGIFALTAATMMILISTPKKAAASPAALPTWGT
jgi:hypothetical protein